MQDAYRLLALSAHPRPYLDALAIYALPHLASGAFSSASCSANRAYAVKRMRKGGWNENVDLPIMHNSATPLINLHYASKCVSAMNLV